MQTIGYQNHEVLVVEDNRVTRELLSIFLKPICKAEQASTGETAIEMAKSKKYSAILMDINLGPGIDGMEATKEIRTLPGYTNTPIIAVTSYNLVGDRERILAEGFSHYIAKPFQKNALLSIVSLVLF